MWFNGRWDDKWCIDITRELIQVIDESWARPECPPPYQIYIKMAYHLAEEARAGLSEFTIPADMRGVLLEFQSAAVRIAARHLEKRGGVILGDVVGLGKTLMATALARMFQDPPRSLETLILCPRNLVGMWEDHAHRYRLIAKVVSVTQAQNVLPDLRRYRVVIIDESHNLRNREGRRWAGVRDYISRNASKCILLSATPYNKAYLDLANQIRLFLEPEDVVGIRPEEYLRRDCDGRPDEFTRRHQCPLNCLAAFEKSYGLANYLKPTLDTPPTADEAEVMMNLSRAGKRLMGFCRTNFFKRLESSGHAFLLSVRRHILRNFIYLHALDKGLPVPVGTQDSSLFDPRTEDHDSDSALFGRDSENSGVPRASLTSAASKARAIPPQRMAVNAWSTTGVHRDWCAFTSG